MRFDELSEKAHCGLVVAGWRDGRRVEVPHAYVSMCSELGRNEIPSSVSRLIESFDGLRLVHPHFQSKDIDVCTVFDSAKTLRNMSWAILRTEYEPAAGDGPLYPFAQTDYGLFFMASIALKIYGGYSPYLGMYGVSVVDFLNRLYDERRPVILKN
ncbi:hypothetical protein GCM10029978_097240 [Actinoallomurus acanthiterrae]